MLLPTAQTARLNLTNMKTNTGFTLVEVLVAVVVLAVGLLGLAGLQASSLGNNQSAYTRSLATQLAYDIADRMRANVVNTGLMASSAYCVNPPAPAPQLCTAGRPAPLQVASCGAPPGATVAGCTTVQMAQNDVFEWNRDIDNALGPNATRSITVVAATRVFTITLSWDDDRDGDVDGNDPNFQTSFRL